VTKLLQSFCIVVPSFGQIVEQMSLQGEWCWAEQEKEQTKTLHFRHGVNNFPLLVLLLSGCATHGSRVKYIQVGGEASSARPFPPVPR